MRWRNVKGDVSEWRAHIYLACILPHFYGWYGFLLAVDARSSDGNGHSLMEQLFVWHVYHFSALQLNSSEKKMCVFLIAKTCLTLKMSTTTGHLCYMFKVKPSPSFQKQIFYSFKSNTNVNDRSMWWTAKITEWFPTIIYFVVSL